MSSRKRRTRIMDKPDLPLNLWSIMRNCIGKELSKIPMPVNFSEPLSVLQRITEDLEYAHLLLDVSSFWFISIIWYCVQSGAQAEDSLVQMCWVAAYAVSSYSTTGYYSLYSIIYRIRILWRPREFFIAGNRTTKPFNPLLGETFECDRRDDFGWRSVAEQVSHHPPAAAQHAEGRGWTMYQDFTMTSRFRQASSSLSPLRLRTQIVSESY